MLEPDPTQAAAFVGALTGNDGWNTVVTFQTFDDSPMKRATLAGVINGTLVDFAEEARRINNLGAGIYVTIQETNQRGRRADCITAARALYIDIDDALPRTYSLPPSITVRTPNGQHIYWLLEEGAPLGDIPPLLKRLSMFYHSDQSVCDISRVLRLPGYFHCKGEPTPVVLTHCSDLRYSLADVREAHPVEEPVYRPVRVIDIHAETTEQRESRYRRWATFKPIEKGMRHKKAYHIALEGFERQLPYHVVEAVVASYCESAGLTDRDLRDVMTSATKAHQRRA